MKRNFSILILVCACSALLASSCNRKEDIERVIPESLEGLWVESMMNAITGDEFGYAINIKSAENVEVNYLRSDNDKRLYLDRVETAELSRYDKEKGEGVIALQNGENIEFTLGLTGGMFTSDHRILSQYSFTLDDILNPGNLMPALKDENGPSFQGPADPSFEKLGTTVVPVPDITEAFLGWLGPIVARTAATYGCNAIFKAIFEDDQAAKMDEVIEKVNEMSRMLTELTELFHNTNYEKYLNDRTNNYIAPLRNYTSEYYTRLENCDGTEESIKKIAIEWGDGTIGGNKACVQYQNFIDFLTKSIVEQKSLYQIYDIYVFNTTPWEADGYAFREGIRSCDLAVIAQNAFMATLYYRAKEGLDDKSRDTFLAKIKTYVDTYREYLENYPVERHDDMAICQIKDLHMSFSRNLAVRDYYNKPWFPNGSEWDSENNESAWVLTYGKVGGIASETYRNSFSPNEIAKLMEYYKGEAYNNFGDLLREKAGCTVPEDVDGKTHILLCQGDGYTERYEYDDYKIYASEALQLNKSKTCGRQDIGIGYLEHYGFLWLNQRFSHWTSAFDHNRIWLYTDIERY